MVKKDDIIVEHINTQAMVVDPLTKGLRSIDFKRHVVNMGILESFHVLN